MADRVIIVQNDLQTYAASSPPLFDGILIDTPCSGTGVIRRHPDIRWNRQADDITKLHKTQLELLQTAADMLVPGGIIVYATCSLEPEENAQVMSKFLQLHPDFTLTDCRQYLPKSAAQFIDDTGCFAPLPAEEIEGFFAARLSRNSGE